MLDFSRWPHKLGPPFKWDSQKGIQMRRIVKFCPPGNPLWQILTWNRLILWVTDIGVQKDHLQQTIRKTSIEQQSKLAVLYWKWMNICKVYVFFNSNGINVKIEWTDVFAARSQVYTIKHALSSMRLADRHATWPVGKTSLHLDPHCDHHHLLQQWLIL